MIFLSKLYGGKNTFWVTGEFFTSGAASSCHGVSNTFMDSTGYTYVYHLIFCPVPPVLSVHRVEYTAVLGRPVSLECVADGQPQPEVSWHKERRPVVDSARIRVFANGTLAITSTQRSDAGFYTCTDKNLAGRASHDMRLVIQGDTEYNNVKSSRLTLC